MRGYGHSDRRELLLPVDVATCHWLAAELRLRRGPPQHVLGQSRVLRSAALRPRIVGQAGGKTHPVDVPDQPLPARAVLPLPGNKAPPCRPKSLRRQFPKNLTIPPREARDLPHPVP